MIFVDCISTQNTKDVHWNVIGHCLFCSWRDKLGCITKIANKTTIEISIALQLYKFNDDLFPLQLTKK